MEQTYKSYKAPGARPPPIFHELSVTDVNKVVTGDLKINYEGQCGPKIDSEDHHNIPVQTGTDLVCMQAIQVWI